MFDFLRDLPSKRLNAVCFVALFLLTGTLFTAQLSRAQVFTATLSGLVADPSSAAIPGAAVTVRNVDTSDTRKTTSSADGRYTLSQLPPGAYEITVEAKGFKRYVEKSLALVASQSAEFNVSLTLGETNETVEVEAAAADPRHAIGG